MKTLHTGEAHEVVGAAETKELRIAANYKAFKELISGIYSDKAYAISRELVANAVDAHVAAGTPGRSFQIHVPTTFEPHFSIRDYGVSMTHDTVMNLYSTLFMSTKDDPDSDFSNTQTGKFGLGSKSPFAYTDAFQVTTYLDGVSRIYDVYINDGLPRISLFLETETDEENGVLVDFPVESRDVRDFQRAITKACEALDEDPELTGMQLSIPRPVAIMEGDGWKALQGNDSTRIRMGTVIYPFNSHAVINAPDWLHKFTDCNFLIDLPIGDAEVTTSRESLSYDERTSANIIKVFERVHKDISSKNLQEIQVEKTYADKCAVAQRSLSNLSTPLEKLLRANLPSHKGKPLDYFVTVKRRWVQDTPSGMKPVTLEGFTICHVDSGYTFGSPRFKNPRRPEKGESWVYNPLKKLVVVTEDVSEKKRYSTIRMTKALKDKSPRDHMVLWIRYNSEVTQLDFALKRLFVMFGRPTNYEHINLMDVCVKKETKKAPRAPMPKYDLKRVRNGGGTLELITVDDDQQLEGYYIPTRNNHPMYVDLSISMTTMMKTYEALVVAGQLKELDVYTVPRNKVKVLSGQKKLKDLLPVLKEQVLLYDVSEQLIGSKFAEATLRHELESVNRVLRKLHNFKKAYDDRFNGKKDADDILDLAGAYLEKLEGSLLSSAISIVSECEIYEQQHLSSGDRWVMSFVRSINGDDWYKEEEEIAGDLADDLKKRLHDVTQKCLKFYPVLKLIAGWNLGRDEIVPILQCLYALQNSKPIAIKKLDQTG